MSASKSKSTVGFPYVNKIFRLIYNVDVSQEKLGRFSMNHEMSLDIESLPL
jgi:hypothetical protein